MVRFLKLFVNKHLQRHYLFFAMNTFRILFIGLLSFVAFNCTRLEEPQPQPLKVATEPSQILGEWRYVGNFSHLASYKCIICSDFNYDTSLYSLNLVDNTSVTGRINKVGFSAKYVVNNNGKFSMDNIKYAGIPNLTENDGLYVERISTSTDFGVLKDTPTYDILILTYDSGRNFLAFARKK
jgi:hypothetical protein